jgi:hypothetical protein
MTKQWFFEITVFFGWFGEPKLAKMLASQGLLSIFVEKTLWQL